MEKQNGIFLMLFQLDWYKLTFIQVIICEFTQMCAHAHIQTDACKYVNLELNRRTKIHK